MGKTAGRRADCPSNVELLILAIDGMDYGVLCEGMAQGRLPNFSTLRNRGVFGPLRSTVPPATPSAWTSMITGVNPGKHGIWDFRRLILDDVPQPPAFQSGRAAPSIWEMIGEQTDATLGIWRLPWSYPPETVNGYMLCEMAPTEGTPSYPADLFGRVREHFEWYDTWAADRIGVSQDPEEMLQSVRAAAADEIALNRHLLASYPTDVTLIGVDVTDLVTHRAYSVEAGLETAREIVLASYEAVDAWLPELVDLLAADGQLVIVSDHGGGSMRHGVHLERLLAREGFLQDGCAAPGQFGAMVRSIRSSLAKIEPLRKAVRRIKSAGSRSTGDESGDGQPAGGLDWSSTRVIPWGIYGLMRFNLRGRDPHGCVDPEDTPELTARLREVLMGVSVDGTSVFSDVRPAEQIFWGDCLEDGPDVVAFVRDGCRILPHSGLGEDVLTAEHCFRSSSRHVGRIVESITEGDHRRDGVFIAYGRGIDEGVGLGHAVIWDVAPTILYALGLPVPAHMDGHALTNCFVHSFLEGRPVQFGPDGAGPGYTPPVARDEGVMSDEVSRRLTGIGYM